MRLFGPAEDVEKKPCYKEAEVKESTDDVFVLTC
jgi:hypothetical protein